MVKKHIKRDYSAHKKSVVRPTNEYCKLEIFSYDHPETMYYSVYENNITGENISESNCLSWRCLKSNDNWSRFEVHCNYVATEFAEYRIDILYQNISDLDYTGFIQIFDKGNKIKDDEVMFDGETNTVKRLTGFYHLERGEYKFNLRLPYNCLFFGAIIRKIKYYSGDNIDSADTNLMFLNSSISKSSSVKPSEVSVTIGYDDAFECADSESGFYMDYRDEMNIYTKDDDDEIKQLFGGYISSILPDADRTKLTITGADRLIDGQNKYIMDSMYLLGGTQVVEDYDNELYHDFNSYGEALKFLCDIFESTLKNNINENYLVNGEAYETGLAVTFGKNGNAKNVHATEMTVSENENFVTVRNNPSAEKYQTAYVYSVDEYNIEPVDITDFPNFYLTYGLGDPKQEVGTTDNGNSSSEVAGSFNKYGVSKDGSQIMAIGRPSSAGESGYGYTFWKSVFKRKCPHCGSTELYWSIFWAGNETSNWGKFPATGRNEGGSAEGHIFCKTCDADYSCILGKEHVSGGRTLTRVSGPDRSSKDEAYLLKSGKYGKGNSDTVATADGVFQDITAEAFKYKYCLGCGSSSWATMKSSGYGDCWAFSDFIFTRLKERGVSCKIVQYGTQYADNHRSVMYKDGNGNWVDFPYREYGWNTKYNNMLNNTAGSKSGTVISSFEGNGIDKAGTGTADNKKMTIGYDKDKPFKFYVHFIFSNDKVNTHDYVLNATAQSFHENSEGKLSTYWINNVVKQATINVKDYMADIVGDDDQELKYYLHGIRLKAPTGGEEWYKTDDNTVDESSCKMDLYGLGFNQGTIVNPTDLSSCGKSIISQMETLVKDSGYLVDMDYATHRKDDVINFMVDNQTTPSYTAKEGDDNNILSWGSISYTPVTNLFNTSIYVYKKQMEGGQYYRFVNTKDSNSVLRYGEQTTLQTTSEVITDREAYYNARKKSEKYNPTETYSYTITVPYCPDIDIGDLVKVVADAKKLNTLKRVESVKYVYDYSKIPRLQTTIGLGELAPDLQLKKTLREIRESAKKESTLFSTTATGIEDKNLYQWEN